VPLTAAEAAPAPVVEHVEPPPPPVVEAAAPEPVEPPKPEPVTTEDLVREFPDLFVPDDPPKSHDQ